MCLMLAGDNLHCNSLAVNTVDWISLLEKLELVALELGSSCIRVFSVNGRWQVSACTCLATECAVCSQVRISILAAG